MAMETPKQVMASHGKSSAGVDLSPDVILQSAMISACGKGQQWLKSLELLRLEVRRDMENWDSMRIQ